MNRSALSAAALQPGGTIPTICACCGEWFQARTIHTAYCGVNCRRRARYYRAQGRPIPAKGSKWTQPIRPQVMQPEIITAAPAALEVRNWNGTPIQMRPADGYVNATAMCKANGKHLPHYLANKGTGEYLQALSGSVGIPTDLLVQSITTGPNDLRGTWVHIRVAVYLARLINPPFAVWMDGWFLESMVPQWSTAQPQPAPIAALPSPITAERITPVLATCDPITTNTVLKMLGLPCSRSNQMAVGSVLRGMGYQHSRVRVDGSLTWVYQPAAQPRPQREGVYVVAATPRRAAELWWQAIESEVTGALSRRLNPAHRHDSGLPLVTGYQWQQLALPA